VKEARSRSNIKRIADVEAEEREKEREMGLAAANQFKFFRVDKKSSIFLVNFKSYGMYCSVGLIMATLDISAPI
jgi:hypothetical protein